jgi:hypothetical protein
MTEASDYKIAKGIKSRLEMLEAKGLSEWSFFVGVANLMMSAYLAGSSPENFWVWHTFKSALLLPWVFMLRRARKVHYYLMDLCWVMCAYSCLFGVSLYIGHYTEP